MNKKKILAIQFLLEGYLTKREIAEKLGIDSSTLRRWEQEPEFKKHKEQCLIQIKESVIKDITLLAEKLINSISRSAENIPPKESLEMLLKIIEKGDKLGLSLVNLEESEKKEDFSTLSDEDLKNALNEYLKDSDKKQQ
jgi:transcriptional regulator with XRE-family HTH domain